MKILNLLVLIAFTFISFITNQDLRTIPIDCENQRLAEEEVPILMSEKKLDTNCLKPEFLKDDAFKLFMAKLKTKTIPQIREEKLLELFIKSVGSEMFSPEHTIILFTEIDFENELVPTIKKLSQYIWIHSEDLLSIVEQTKKLSDRMVFVKYFFPLLLDHHEVTFQLITDALDCQDKYLIEELKIKFRPKDCYFGNLIGDTIFIIDLSRSMLFFFEHEGKTVTRLDFLKILFRRAFDSLRSEDQKFQIIGFNSQARYLEKDENYVFSATDAEKKHALELVDSLQVGEGAQRFTNISEALELAYKIKHNFNRVIMFTDGFPTRGITDKEQMKEHIAKIQENRMNAGFKKLPVDVNLLMIAGTENLEFKEAAKYFSKLISTETDGVVKNFDVKL
jgi:hypothetical protein